MFVSSTIAFRGDVVYITVLSILTFGLTLGGFPFVLYNKNGKEKAIGALVGYIMGQTEGQANPQLVNQMLRETLGQT